MKQLIILSVLIASCIHTDARCEPPSPESPSASSGPEHGTLVIVGGGMRTQHILRRFVDLAGGRDAPIVVITTASARPDKGSQNFPIARWFRVVVGVKTVTVLHTDDRDDANSPGFVRPIQEARAVWFSGGRQWRIADSYLSTRVHRELEALLDRGGVIGGDSAGATILGSYLVRGDTETPEIMMGDHEEGFGFLKNVAIDQHLLTRNRHFDLIEIVRAHPELLGIGIDENAAIIVRGDVFEVMGGYTAIYDHSRQLPNRGLFYMLSDGDRFDLGARKPMRRGSSEEFEFKKIQEKQWAHP